MSGDGLRGHRRIRRGPRIMASPVRAWGAPPTLDRCVPRVKDTYIGNSSISEIPSFSSRAWNLSLGECVNPGSYKERPAIPQEPHGHRLWLTIGAHRREPRDRLLPQPPLGPPPASVVVSSTNRSSRPRESPSRAQAPSAAAAPARRPSSSDARAPCRRGFRAPW